VKTFSIPSFPTAPRHFPSHEFPTVVVLCGDRTPPQSSATPAGWLLSLRPRHSLGLNFLPGMTAWSLALFAHLGRPPEPTFCALAAIYWRSHIHFRAEPQPRSLLAPSRLILVSVLAFILDHIDLIRRPFRALTSPLPAADIVELSLYSAPALFLCSPRFDRELPASLILSPRNYRLAHLFIRYPPSPATRECCP